MKLIYALAAILVILWTLAFVSMAKAKETYETKASWYSVESCKREGTCGITASGRPLSDNGYTCASWRHPIGTGLAVRRGSKVVRVIVTDRGPGHKALSKGVTIDLSKVAFSRIAKLEEGVVPVEVVAEYRRGR